MGKSRRKARRLRARERFVRKTKVAALQLAQGCVREVFSGWKKEPGDVRKASLAAVYYARKSTRDYVIFCELRNLVLEAAFGAYDREYELDSKKSRDTKDEPKNDEPKSGARRSRLENVCWNVALYAFFGMLAVATGIAYTPDRWRAIPIALCAFFIFIPVLSCAFFPSRDETP